MARIAQIATVVPEYRYSQAEIFDGVKKVFSRQGQDISSFEPAFFHAGIQYRYAAMPMDWCTEEHSWEDRNRAYIEKSVPLLEKAALASLEGSGFGLEDVTDIVTVSSTGIATPSLEAILMDRLPFLPTVRRTPIFGLGCAGGLMGLQRADQIAMADHANVVMVLVVELCSLNFLRGDLSKQNIIATALFSDGAAGAIVSQKAKGPRIRAGREYRWPDSLSVMGWEVKANGLGVVFSRSIPELVGKEFREVLHDFFQREGLRLGDFRHFLSHPGGGKVIEELEKVFEVQPGSLSYTRQILSEYGNMSAPTVLFVLKRALEQGSSGRSLLTTFGPGFSAGILVVDL